MSSISPFNVVVEALETFVALETLETAEALETAEVTEPKASSNISGFAFLDFLFDLLATPGTPSDLGRGIESEVVPEETPEVEVSASSAPSSRSKGALEDLWRKASMSFTVDA